MKKLLIGLLAIGAVVVLIPLFAAFEAHVINVTAQIENALSVDTTPIDFGTVFPQEELEAPIHVELSSSFLAEDRVDDIDYVIRQKPKCGWTIENGQTLVGETKSGHVDDQGNITCPDPSEDPGDGAVWGQLPLLCPYLSKHKDVTDQDGNDEELDAFHQIGSVNGQWIWNDVRGHLTKQGQDTQDWWVIDLKVPCFGDHCAQDWDTFVTNINDQANPDDYVQPIENEHKIFGCDLWIEVGGISLPNGIGCLEKADVMLVLDRSGSIESGELTTLKTAAKAFVDALAPSASGVHIGMVSFSDNASLDVHLTDNATTVKTAIDGLSSGGSTNLEDGLRTADTELDNPGDTHDRTDGESPDFIVLITDGAPTASDGPGTHEEDAADAADDAKLDGIEIFGVGVGTSTSTANFLKDDIVSSPSSTHYFDAADFGDLEDILETIAACED
jgi:uncharacterized protein YegL